MVVIVEPVSTMIDIVMFEPAYFCNALKLPSVQQSNWNDLTHKVCSHFWGDGTINEFQGTCMISLLLPFIPVGPSSLMGLPPAGTLKVGTFKYPKQQGE